MFVHRRWGNLAGGEWDCCSSAELVARCCFCPLESHPHWRRHAAHEGFPKTMKFEGSCGGPLGALTVRRLANLHKPAKF